MRHWERSGLILLVLLMVSVFGVRLGSLGPESQIPDGNSDAGIWPLTERLVPGTAVNGEPSEESSGAPVDLGGLSLLCGENIEEYSLTGWVTVNNLEAAEEEDLRSMVEQAARSLESALVKDGDPVWPAGTWASGSAEGARGINYLRWLGNDRWVESWARSTYYRGKGADESGTAYLVLRFTGLTGRQMAVTLNQVMEDSLHGLGKEVFTSLEVICWREGGVDEGQMSGLVSKVLATARAREVERSKQDDRLLVSAFSPSISEFSDKGDPPVNLQLAARYRAKDNRTYFYLGIPRIMEGF